MSPKTAVAIRHVAFEDLGSLASVLERRGYRIEIAEAGVDDLREISATVPDLLVVLGGPIGVYEEEVYPFLANERRILQQRLAADRPTLGICLGAQLMASALGSRVYPAKEKELGWAPLQLTDAGKRSWLAPLAAAETSVLHWHGDTFDLPEGAELLASTPACANQAFRWKRRCVALQFHVEATRRGLERWFIGHTLEISTTEGVSVASLRADTARCAPGLEEVGRRCLEAWLAEVEAPE
jgi:GMP synthase (glutamine-hydrolysing)